MKFDKQYLSYNEYLSLGGELTQKSFNLNEFKAEKEVDILTSNRFKKINEYPKELKLCIFDLVETISEQTNSSYSSETVGSYSVSSASNSDITNIKLNTIKKYLSGVLVNDVPVLYRGADINEN